MEARKYRAMCLPLHPNPVVVVHDSVGYECRSKDAAEVLVPQSLHRGDPVRQPILGAGLAVHQTGRSIASDQDPYAELAGGATHFLEFLARGNVVCADEAIEYRWRWPWHALRRINQREIVADFANAQLWMMS